MLVDDYIVCYLDEYVTFVLVVQWYEIFVEAGLGHELSDYLYGCEQAQKAYSTLSAGFSGETELSRADLRKFRDLSYGGEFIESLGELAKRLENGEDVTKKLLRLLRAFMDTHEPKFRDAYIEFLRWQAAKTSHWEGLHAAVESLIKARSPDEVVVAAFKHLDHLLRQVVGAKDYESYGEDLISRAFNNSTGALQLNTIPNEQQGLRNLVSGAYALFRNPSAHRYFLKGKESIMAGTHVDPSAKIVMFVDVLETIVHNLYRMNLSPKVHKVLLEFADLFATEDGEIPDVYGTNDDWGIRDGLFVILDYSDDAGFSWFVTGWRHQDTPILKKVCSKLTADTGLDCRYTVMPVP